MSTLDTKLTFNFGHELRTQGDQRHKNGKEKEASMAVTPTVKQQAKEKRCLLPLLRFSKQHAQLLQAFTSTCQLIFLC